jgi:ABC-type multidrug transport system fused ATPase/permease subunit
MLLNSGGVLAATLKWKDLKKVVVEDHKEIRTKSKMLQHWPVDGRIDFRNVIMRYRPLAGPALNGMNLSIKHGEKVGIVGRTGSGKSTPLMALYRMFDLVDGSITVAGGCAHAASAQGSPWPFYHPPGAGHVLWGLSREPGPLPRAL